MFENMEETEVKINKTDKVVYIGPNIEGLISGTVFDYMPELENYSIYEGIEKLFVPIGLLKEKTLELKEKSNYLHFVYDKLVEIKKRKGSVD